MYKDLEEVFDTLNNLKRLEHIKEFEYNLIFDYISNLNKLVKETVENNLQLKSDIEKYKAQIEILEKVINNEKDLFSSNE